MRTRLSILIIIASLTLAGCAGLLPEPAPPPAEVDFGPATETTEAEPLPTAVTLTRVQAPSWMQGTAIHYRDADRAPNLLERYANHIWAAPPADLLAEQVEAMLHARAPATNGQRARLELRLTRFEHVLTENNQAHADARVTARLYSPDGRLQREADFRTRVDITPDVNGAIEGLPTAAGQLTSELGEWLSRHL